MGTSNQANFSCPSFSGGCFSARMRCALTASRSHGPQHSALAEIRIIWGTFLQT